MTERMSVEEKLIADLAGALRFILAFYEPGQNYLDTVAWDRAEKSGRYQLAEAEKFLAARTPATEP